MNMNTYMHAGMKEQHAPIHTHTHTREDRGEARGWASNGGNVALEQRERVYN